MVIGDVVLVVVVVVLLLFSQPTTTLSMPGMQEMLPPQPRVVPTSFQDSWVSSPTRSGTGGTWTQSRSFGKGTRGIGEQCQFGVGRGAVRWRKEEGCMSDKRKEEEGTKNSKINIK